MREQDEKFLQLYREYTARFCEDPVWNLTLIEQAITDMEEALRLGRPIPADDRPNATHF